MPIGPGKYDNHVTKIREQTQAEAVVLVVVGGKKGHGFAVQARGDIHYRLPAMLRAFADELEASPSPLAD